VIAKNNKKVKILGLPVHTHIVMYNTTTYAINLSGICPD